MRPKVVPSNKIIVDAILRAKVVDPTPRTRAIVIYPMNALANSQLEELQKFLPDSDRPATFARYTGQESDSQREQIRATRPTFCSPTS